MFEVLIPDTEIFIEEANEFIKITGCKLKLEHSLVSIQKWESKWHKPFLNKKEDKTFEQIIDYIRCMTTNPEDITDPAVYKIIPKAKVAEILEYLKDPMTATVIYKGKKKGRSVQQKTVTAELIYYWMISLNIPIEFQYWHINRLMTLIELINEEAGPKEKMSKREILEENRRLNEERLKKLKTRG